MNIFSSIPSRHANGNEYIDFCVNSWQKHGKVYSVNHPNEIAEIKHRFSEVTFIPTYQTQIAITGKPLVTIDSILNELRFRHEGKSIFINSDCSLTDDKELLKAKFVDGKFTYLHRWNYDESIDNAAYYINGIDAFLFSTVSVLDSIQQTHYCIGQTYFDLWYPYAIQMAGMGLITSPDKIVFHKNHKEQYSIEDWKNMGKYTGFLIKRDNYKPADVSNYLYAFLRKLTTTI